MVDALPVAVAVVAFAAVAELLERTGRLPEGVSVTGPFVTLSSTRGRALLGRLARPRRLWRGVGTLGLAGVGVAMAFAAVGVLLVGAAALADPGASPIDSPGSVLVIPGVNRFLPPAAAPEILFAVLAGLVVHEGGHGIYCRVEEIEVDSVGLFLLTVIPAGAYVLPDEASDERENLPGWARMFAAGPVNNVVLTVVAFLALVLVLGSVQPVPGVAVGGAFAGAPAADAGIDHGDVLTSVSGTPVRSEADLDAALANVSGTVRVERADGPPVEVRPEPTVVQAADGAPLTTPETVVAVNGTNVSSDDAFRAALDGREVATLRVRAGTIDPGFDPSSPSYGDDRTRTVVAAMGLSGRVAEGGALAAAGLPAGERVVLVRVDGDRTLDLAALADALADRDPGDEIRVVAYVPTEGSRGAGTRRELPVTLGGDSEPVVGIVPEAGISGLVVSDFGVGVHDTGTYLTALRGGGIPATGADGLLGRAFAFLLLPLAGVTGLARYNFAGFVGPARSLYELTGPLAAFGDAGFALANGLFWLVWLNVQLAAFNCIPAYPLDGGRLVRVGTEWLGGRYGVADPVELGERVMLGTTLAMLSVLGLLLVVSIAL
ncbi:site-2 protease family protein [Haloglomus litoreum]|uniref:site-2 protease family protein n=1 Tax=Haloglomus litoreum TaxID=3034026 RepID=UPI0023E88456|nr:site-2 protease family protein [Haloglomus sp. DT116]